MPVSVLADVCDTSSCLQVRATSAMWRSTTRTASSSSSTTGNRWVGGGRRHTSVTLSCFLRTIVSSVLRWPPALWASFGFLWFKHPLPVLEKWGEKKRNLLQFCDGQMICVGSSGKSVFRTLAFVWVGSSCSHCTWAFSGVLSSVKVEISFLLT